jgi:thiamine-phosphate pyrophosphorylase
MKTISKLQFITTNAATAELACKGGADWIQLRIKDVSYEAYRAEALKTQAICRRYSAALIINDNARLALEIGADGVHLGKTDIITPEEEAALISGNYIVGRTTNTAADIDELNGRYVSYVGLGPYRFTGTKKNLSPILGLDGYKAILAHLKTSYSAHPPIIAIGGIIQYDIPSLLDAGVYGIAVSGAIANAVDITAKTADFVEVINKPKLEPKDEHSISDAFANSDLIGKITGFLTDL